MTDLFNLGEFIILTNINFSNIRKLTILGLAWCFQNFSLVLFELNNIAFEFPSLF